MFPTPAAHAANPPSTWAVTKVREKLWHLTTKDGAVIVSATTKKDAEAMKTGGFHALLYANETRWYAGETIPGWKPYSVVVAENERLAAWRASRPVAV